MFYDIFVPAVTVLTSPKAERDQVERSLYSDGQLQISFNARIFIINPLNKLVSVSAFVGILPPHFGAASVTNGAPSEDCQVTGVDQRSI
ncbi:hypothetical protein DPMN_164617 [Dreissena polymorpha]|uniref:Uncharacterized protein n=1 Tax=Dreissena polymorpha TaxID=45954 RepID=A0A9D4EYV3_DREPO|nr:hypothetical protein DPMN_164617 [Dreissena polymorpha]